MAIEEFKSQLTALKDYGEADLEMSEATRDAYLGIIKDLRTALKEQRGKAAEVQGIWSAGNLDSAQETRDRLELNVTGTDGILATLDDYIEYLDEFEATVNAAFKRVQSDG